VSLHPDPSRRLAALAFGLGSAVRDERLRRNWTLTNVALRAGISRSLVHWVEAGHPASLETYVRLARALGLRLDAELVDDRRRAAVRAEDPVHAAMGEMFAAKLRGASVTVALDEPCQHYQFAGRADVLAWSTEWRALLHIENRTRFPNLQDAYGSYNAKRQYLPAVIADRLKLSRGFETVTHVMACLWSSEILRVLRAHGSSFAALCPDPPEPLDSWLHGRRPDPGVTSSLVLLDPLASRRERLYVGRSNLGKARSRYRGYADAAERLRT